MRGRKKSTTIKSIKEEFAAKGANLLTTEYLGCEQKLHFQCSCCGEDSFITYRKYSLGQNSKLLCRSCMKSVSIEQIRDVVNASGSELLSTQFGTVDSPLEVRCRDCGNIFTFTWANYKQAIIKSFFVGPVVIVISPISLFLMICCTLYWLLLKKRQNSFIKRNSVLQKKGFSLFLYIRMN